MKTLNNEYNHIPRTVNNNKKTINKSGILNVKSIQTNEKISSNYNSVPEEQQKHRRRNTTQAG
jgi:hypothetical protein